MPLKLVLFVVPVVLCGWIIGWMNLPGPWYEALAKPSFNPPNWVFGPVWTVLYVIIGIVGWRVWEKSRDQSLRVLWIVQLLLNFAWSPVFFGMQNVALALLVIGLLLAAIVAFTIRARRREPLSAAMFLPYLAWVSFATLLNAAIWRMN